VTAVFLHDSIRSNQANFRVQALVGMGRVFLRHPHGARGTMRDSMKEPRDKTPSAARQHVMPRSEPSAPLTQHAVQSTMNSLAPVVVRDICGSASSATW
jgi:hypothetical protein